MAGEDRVRYVRVLQGFMHKAWVGCPLLYLAVFGNQGITVEYRRVRVRNILVCAGAVSVDGATAEVRAVLPSRLRGGTLQASAPFREFDGKGIPQSGVRNAALRVRELNRWGRCHAATPGLYASRG